MKKDLFGKEQRDMNYNVICITAPVRIIYAYGNVIR